MSETKCNSSEKSGESNSVCLEEETLKWLAALETYVKVTQTWHLDLEPKRVGTVEAAAVYRFLPNLQITDFNISCNKLAGVEDLLQALVATKTIKTIGLCPNIFSNEELLRLLEGLKNTHVTEIFMEECEDHGDDPIEFDADETEKFISLLLESHFTLLCFQPRFLPPVDDSLPTLPSDVIPLLRVIGSTSLTLLDLSDSTYSRGVLSSLFSNLPSTAITELSLSNIQICEEDLEQLSLNLKDSKVETLNLSLNAIGDSGLEVIAKGLAQSKVQILHLARTSLTGACSLGPVLQETQIEELYLNSNHITSQTLFSFPKFLRLSPIKILHMDHCGLSDKLGRKLMESLKSSKVTSLLVGSNYLGRSSISKFSKVLSDTMVCNVNFSYNFLSIDEAAMLGKSVKNSNLKSIIMNGAFVLCPTHSALALSPFLEKSKDASLSYVAMCGYKLDANNMKQIASSLVGTTLLSLNLSSNQIGDGIDCLSSQLKFTTITSLYLAENRLGDAGAEILANCLGDTKISFLDLSKNEITDRGAKALAACLRGTNLYRLSLSSNRIQNEGLEVLAKHAEGTFVSELSVASNPGNRDILIDRILLENKTAKHRFVSFFKRIAPEKNANSFRLDDNVDNNNAEAFLEECFLFHKASIEESSAVSVLLEDKSSSFSRDEIVLLLKEEFPQQFATFVVSKIEASAMELVSILKRAEELRLNNLVEMLLLNRPAFTIDQNGNILHPLAYKLLHKYKQPLFNLGIEPDGKNKIIEYFSEHQEVEGAVDVLSVLSDNSTLK